MPLSWVPGEPWSAVDGVLGTTVSWMSRNPPQTRWSGSEDRLDPPGLLGPLLPACRRLREDPAKSVSVAVSLRKSIRVSQGPRAKGAVTNPDPLLGASLTSVPLRWGHCVPLQPHEPSATASV